MVNFITEWSAAIAAAEAAAANAAVLNTIAESNSIDVYIRACNADICFRVPKTERVSYLYTIFESLPILQPSHFYWTRPKGFSVSVHPGYLTSQGALLFTDDATEKKWLKPLRDDAVIGDALAEGQLIVPTWKLHVWNLCQIFAILYSEFMALQPGIPKSAQRPSIFPTIYNFMGLLFGLQKAPDSVVRFFNHWAWTQFCFVFFVLIDGLFYWVLSSGRHHWYEMTLAERKWWASEVPRQGDFIKAGWTGVRRISCDDWPRFYWIICNKKARDLDMLPRTEALAKPAGLMLHTGEGWNVLAGLGDVSRLSSMEVGSNLLDSRGKFVVSQTYFAALGAPIASVRQEEESETVHTAVQQFREFGYDEGPGILTDLFALVERTHDVSLRLEDCYKRDLKLG